jgi:branched-chain amino acid transport system ATP-binding protein
VLEIRGLSKNFGGLSAISEFDLSINQRELVGLIGPNGAGKTTIFNLITGFLRPTRGKIIFEGNNIVGRKPHDVAEKGMVRTFQATNIFSNFTVLQNIVAACHLNPRIGFWEAALHTSNSRMKEENILNQAIEIMKFVGLESMKDIPAQSLPHGYKRILGIAIALAARPRLLLLDEPLSGMNAEEVSETMGLINRAWQSGMTILLIEHNMRATMNLCERIVVLNFGKKIAEGSPEEIKGNKEVIQAYLGTRKHAT